MSMGKMASGNASEIDMREIERGVEEYRSILALEGAFETVLLLEVLGLAGDDADKLAALAGVMSQFDA